MSPRSIIYTLGYAGLVPFVIPAVLLAGGSAHADLAVGIAETYAFGIICFLTGSWWGMAYKTGSRSVLVISNIVFLCAFLLLLLAPDWWSFAAAILLTGLFALEQIDSLFPALPHYYRKMRAILTLIAGSSMFVIHFAR